jgi:glycosyltransferase involved in cell wall biosynthesis
MIALPWGLDAIGGVTQVVLGLYDGIEKDGRLRPGILVASWGDTEPVEQVDAAGRLIVRSRVRSPSGRGSLVSNLVHYVLALPAELRRIHMLARRYSIQVVNCHYIGSSEFTWTVARMLGLYRGKMILSLHGLDIRTLAARRGVRRQLWAWVLRRADAVVACSEGLAAETIEAFGLRSDHVVTIHNGVDITRLTQRQPEPPPSERQGGPRLLNLATFEHKKGHDVLLRAFSRVLERYPDAHLTIMGRRAETTDATLRLVDELGLRSSTTIRTDTPHGQALAALAGTDMFVLSSRNEAFSIALLEAGAFGKPVVATSVCGVPELIHDGVTGVRVPPEDPQALADGILRLLDDPAMAAQCARRLHDLVQRRFTLDENCRRYLKLVGYRTEERHALADQGTASSTSSQS